MTPVEARLTQLLAQYGYPPARVDVDGLSIRAVFVARPNDVTVETRYAPGVADATIASDLIIRAAARGVRVTR
jgi:hypothetical protein